MQFASIYQAGTWPHSEESASRVCIQHLLCGGGFNPHQPPPEYATGIQWMAATEQRTYIDPSRLIDTPTSIFVYERRAMRH